MKGSEFSLLVINNRVQIILKDNKGIISSRIVEKRSIENQRTVMLAGGSILVMNGNEVFWNSGIHGAESYLVDSVAII